VACFLEQLTDRASQAKYVTCLSGSVFDLVVDIRVGSPTFGRWNSTLLDDRDRRPVHISEDLFRRTKIHHRRISL
jgi:dTDP-4-dehydrorhamnose 3,5-epimerase-like enzyme